MNFDHTSSHACNVSAAALLPELSPLVSIDMLHRTLDVVQHAEQGERLFGDLALVVGIRFVKLATRVGLSLNPLS